MQSIKPLALTLLTALFSLAMSQVCNPDNPKDTKVSVCDNTDDGLCMVGG